MSLVAGPLRERPGGALLTHTVAVHAPTRKCATGGFRRRPILKLPVFWTALDQRMRWPCRALHRPPQTPSTLVDRRDRRKWRRQTAVPTISITDPEPPQSLARASLETSKCRHCTLIHLSQRVKATELDGANRLSNEDHDEFAGRDSARDRSARRSLSWWHLSMRTRHTRSCQSRRRLTPGQRKVDMLDGLESHRRGPPPSSALAIGPVAILAEAGQPYPVRRRTGRK
jgi:hypothetical protein